MSLTNHQILLASRPQGEATVDNFKLVEVPVPSVDQLAEGQVLVRHHYLSLDPYMRGRMNDSKSYAEPQPLDTVMIGGTVGEVVASQHPRFAAGDKVLGMGGWQENTPWWTPVPRAPCCTRSTPRTSPCRRTWAQWACLA